MDLSPFTAINPCGYSDLEVTQLADLGVAEGVDAVGERLTGVLAKLLAPRTAKETKHE